MCCGGTYHFNRKRIQLRVLDKSQDNMLASELDNFLLWYHIRKQDQMGKSQKLESWNTICEDNQAPSSYEKWIKQDEAKMEEMKNKKVDTKETILGMFEATCKRKYDAVADKMLKEERDTLMRNMEYQEDMEKQMRKVLFYAVNN